MDNTWVELIEVGLKIIAVASAGDHSGCEAWQQDFLKLEPPEAQVGALKCIASAGSFQAIRQARLQAGGSEK